MKTLTLPNPAIDPIYGMTVALKRLLKDGWHRFTNENTRENTAHTPMSCHRVPPEKKGEQ